MPAPNLPGILLDRAHPLSRGLALWLPMNEGGGSRVNDVSGNGNHGSFGNIAQGATSGWTGGHHGSAVRFDATDDQITVPTSASLAITGEITMCAWVNITSFASFGHIMGKGTSYPNPYAFAYYPDKRTTMSRGNGSSQGYLEGVVGSIVGGRPEFLCATWKGGVNSLYVDGALSSSNSSVNPTVTDDGQPLYIGRRRDSVIPFAGSMWHVRIYNRALSALEISELYANPMAGAYWDGHFSSEVYGVLAKTIALTLAATGEQVNEGVLAKTIDAALVASGSQVNVGEFAKTVTISLAAIGVQVNEGVLAKSISVALLARGYSPSVAGYQTFENPRRSSGGGRFTSIKATSGGILRP